MHIKNVMIKYFIVLALMLYWNINPAFSQENISVYIAHSNIKSEYIDEFIKCLNKHNIKIIKSTEKNYNYPMFFDDQYKLYKYYKSSIQINFYDAYLNNGTIDDDIIMFYYFEINKKYFNRIFNKNNNKFRQAKRIFDINISYQHNNALVLATGIRDIFIDGKFSTINLGEENNYSDAINNIKTHCLK